MNRRLERPGYIKRPQAARRVSPPVAVGSYRQRWRALAQSVLGVRLALVVVLVIAAVFTGYNMFNYPHYESDEGTYIGSAWAMFTHGTLSYYTYTYDHPPFGWFVLGAWSSLTGGFRAFGMSINSGRALMLVVTVVSTLLVFACVRRATGRTVAAMLAAMIFAVSPLGVSLHRQVWLDNLATLWMLMSVYALISADGRLGRIMLSAVAFGLMFWSKEVFVVLLPSMLCLVAVQSDREHRRFAVVLWTALALALISFFVLLALLKDELLPAGVLWSSSQPHVSMLEIFKAQAARPGGGSLLNPASQFRAFWQEWQWADPVLMIGGMVAAGVGLVLWWCDRVLACVSVMALTYVLFLGRGGVVLYYYIIPVIALFALVIGLLAGRLLDAVPRWRPVQLLGTLAVFTLTLSHTAQAFGGNHKNFTLNNTQSQDVAARWIADNLANDSILVMDSYPWVDLRDPHFTNGKLFVNAHYYWPTVRDPSVHTTVLHDNWRNIDYLVLSPSTEADIVRGSLAGEPLLRDARAHADEVQTFHSGEWSVKIMRVRKLHQSVATQNPILTQTWANYKQRFIRDGRVVDPANGQTTAQAQADAMLRAVYMNDRATFDAFHAWVEQHLRKPDTALHASVWGAISNNAQGVVNERSDAGADQNMALALVLASRRWSVPAYAEQGRALVSAIWDRETTVVAGRRVVVAGDWAQPWQASGQPGPTVAPAMFAPYAYRIFAQLDGQHAWNELVDSSYDVLGRIHADQAVGGAQGLMPQAVILDAQTMNPLPAADEGARRFTADASRVPWAVALDWLWSKDNRAKTELEHYRWLWDELGRSGRLASAYNMDGTPAANDERIATYSGVLASMLVGGDRDQAQQFFAQKVFSTYRNESGHAYWGTADTLDDQTWGWWTSALMDGGLGNLWAGETVTKWDDVLP